MTNGEFKVLMEKRTVEFSVDVIVAKDASESEYWLLVLKELHPDFAEIEQLRAEAGELVRIFDKARHSAAHAR